MEKCQHLFRSGGGGRIRPRPPTLMATAERRFLPRRLVSANPAMREKTEASKRRLVRSGAFLLESQHPPGRRPLRQSILRSEAASEDRGYAEQGPVVVELCPGKPALRGQWAACARRPCFESWNQTISPVAPSWAGNNN